MISCAWATQRRKDRGLNLSGVLPSWALGGVRGMICTVMEAAKGVPHRLPWQELLSCEYVVDYSWRNMLTVLSHLSTVKSWARSVLQCTHAVSLVFVHWTGLLHSSGFWNVCITKRCLHNLFHIMILFQDESDKNSNVFLSFWKYLFFLWREAYK